MIPALMLTLAPPISLPTGREWRLVESAPQRYWQPLAPDSVFRENDAAKRAALISERTRTDDARLGGTGGCAPGMARVHGLMRDPNDTLERQNRACLDPGPFNPVYLCQHFDPKALAPESAHHLEMNFCIDRYEFPNVAGELPAVMLSYNDGVALCSRQGKRLCTEDEWTFACEGEEAWPYPYGYDRYLEPGAHFPDHIPHGEGCNIDVIRPVHASIPTMMAHEWDRTGLTEIDALWNGTASGSRSQCESPFRVFDLTGNIEEWTTQVPGRPRNLHGAPSVLKGGYWSPVRSRCQTAELAHGPGHRYYQTGFRCCANPG
jgi:hypothetical protein